MYSGVVDGVRVYTLIRSLHNINPHNIDIFYCLILLCGVRLDLRPRFTICTYRNETDSLYLLCISYLTSFTWHIIWRRIRKVPLQHPWATFLSYTLKLKWLSEQDIQYPITSLIVETESHSLCLYHVFRIKEASSYIYFAIEFFFLSGCNAINLPGSDRTPTHIWLYACHLCVELSLSEMKSQEIAWQSHKISELWCWWFLCCSWKWSSRVKLTPHSVMRVNKLWDGP